eukprot:CAMPEP_0184696990 /NCGR_PEP_ID=MMETSP0313-20130426/4127_1 /TAXON_ID=2792 /ORGANISM="Porphyridium aerugineum, Strain SAG 1380-2" /LENGTH=62 /DNA_ID=CAMNT_0027155749 /DNA_START=120 /DNA_END=305 /DNA_ORIENTATION=+
MAKASSSLSTPANRVTQLMKKPAFHIAVVIAFLFATTLMADNVIEMGNKVPVAEVSSGVMDW